MSKCPKCDTEFGIEIWSNGECPTCGNEYWYEEYCTDDYEDCWAELHWEHPKPPTLKWWQKLFKQNH